MKLRIGYFEATRGYVIYSPRHAALRWINTYPWGASNTYPRGAYCVVKAGVTKCSGRTIEYTSYKHYSKEAFLVDLPQVDHGGGGRRGGCEQERQSREWSTCVARRNLNHIKNFGANNFDIKRVCTFHTIASPCRQWSTKTFSRNWYFFAIEWNSLHQVWKQNNWPK